MKRITFKTKHTLAFVLAGMLVAGSAFADKPSGAGGDGDKHGRKDKHENRNDGQRGGDKSSGHNKAKSGKGEYFDEHRRMAADDYYRAQFRSGRCPPGLAKKHNGCMPPGQARKWVVGRALPRDVIFYDVPQQLVVKIGQPPAGHRYVRVATDILLIAVGTGMVVDAIDDLGRM
ncbi:MAG: RcnB family protein [Gallionella sp.]|nr:RcnB family protein [Gallionella sp.]